MNDLNAPNNIRQNPTNEPFKTNMFPPKNWMTESILVTIFCCQITGIIGIINASNVESRFYRGDIDGANRAAKVAKQMVVWSVVVMGVFFFAAMAFYAVFIIAAINENYSH